MINLGAQYYRPPFPEPRYWEEDLRALRDAGLNTVQLWVLWSWVEAVPGEFRFEDYDQLVALADGLGLGIVLSTIAEIQPYWIHREVPGSEMVTSMGLKVVSSNRGECHFGITPGGCTDHPGVWERMARFLEAVGRQYQGATNLRGLDAWNELRWNVHADGLVCYCPHTLEAFRRWLDERYGGLDGLNRAWKRRYGNWDEVWPGKVPEIEIVTPKSTAESFLYVKSGAARGQRLLFVFFSPKQKTARLRMRKGWLKSGRMKDLITSRTISAGAPRVDGSREVVIPANQWRFSVLVEA